MAVADHEGGRGRVRSGQREHELQTFLRQDVAEIASEYARIYSRTAEDPGTAGDEGEENWAAVLRGWLPDSYKVVTKGRVLGVDGTASPQIDILVLKPAYPSRLLDKKLYLVHGVAAAFECKTTLKSNHIKDAGDCAAIVRRIAGPRTGSPYRELVSPPVYGILAHSHSWKGQGSSPRENIDRALAEVHMNAAHPRDLLDLVCVADLGCWILIKTVYMGGVYFGADWPSYRDRYGLPDEGGPQTAYCRWQEDSSQPEPNPVAVLVALLLQHLGGENADVRLLADYFSRAGLLGSSQGRSRSWPLHDVYSDTTAARLQAGGAVNGAPWNEWGMIVP